MSRPAKTSHGPILARLKLEGGGAIKVYADTEVTCGVHGTKRRFGDLDGMQRLCVEENLCSVETLGCLISASTPSEPEPTHGL